MQTVSQFVNDPITGLSPIDNTARPVAEYIVSGSRAPVAILPQAIPMSDVTNIWTPFKYLWRRSSHVLTR